MAVGAGTKLGWATKVRVGTEGSFTIGSRTEINAECLVICRREITIGSDCALGWGITILDSDLHPIADTEDELPDGPRSAPVRIGDRVWIGAESMILPGVTIGDGAVVAARSVVTKDVPAGALAAGHPAKVVRDRVAWRP
jgi:acetyltransferase-like isoleucine patch superfamily enzyme